MRRYILIGIGIILIAAVVGEYYLWGRAAAKPPPAFDLSSVPQATSSPSAPVEPRTPPTGYTEYQNATYGLSLFYPSELSVQTYDEGGGAMTITFQNAQAAEGFQMFTVPYSGTQVSEQRFQEDEPSGVRNDPQYGLIDGAPAASFYGSAPELGDTYEVWFIHGGYLFEVTTFKSLDTWLQGIMESWMFIPVATSTSTTS